jgi:methylated-DNA-[protein]-cysteine S-methyltransferase
MIEGDVRYTFMESPVGRLVAAWNTEGVVSIRFGPILGSHGPDESWRLVPGARNTVVEQLEAYFRGELRSFDLRVAMRGTPFQREVWNAVARIPYGETRSYADVAGAIGRPKAVRAVGAANGRNDVPIVIPCHRVIGKGGELRGYAGGVDLKERLLRLERAAIERGVVPAGGM